MKKIKRSKVMKTKVFITVLFAVIFIVPSAVLALAINTNDTFLEYQTYLEGVITWTEYDGSGVTVAVLDSGVQQNNPDLISALWKNYNEIPNNNIDDDNNGYVDDYYGYNFVDDSADMSVYDEHGTAVASIIAAKRNNNYGIYGIAPASKIMTLIVCDEYGCNDNDIVDGIKYAVDNGADIINLSLGGSGTLGYNYIYDSVIRYAADRGVLIVVSAGNSDPEGVNYGNNLDIMKQSPVCNEPDDRNLILGVGASKKSDRSKPIYWSSYGDKYVDIWAQGEKVAALSVKSFSGYDADFFDGTSFSAPLVSAAAALLKEKNPEWSGAELMSQILSHAPEMNGIKYLDFHSILFYTSKNSKIYEMEPQGLVDRNQKIYLYGEYFYSDIDFYIQGDTISSHLPQSAVKLLSTDKLEIDLSKVSFLNSGESYTLEMKNIPSFSTDKQITFSIKGLNQQPSTEILSSDGDMIKIKNNPAVYLLENGIRKLFVNFDTYHSWHGNDFSGVKEVTQDEFDDLLLGKNVTVKPGNYIKFENSNSIYYIQDGSDICKTAETPSNIYIIQSAFEMDYTRNGDCS